MYQSMFDMWYVYKQDRCILIKVTTRKKHLHTFTHSDAYTHTYTISTQTDLSTFSKFVKERNDAVFVGEFRSPPKTTLAYS